MENTPEQQPPIHQIYPFMPPPQVNDRLDKNKSVLFYLGAIEIVLGALSCLLGLLSIIAVLSYRYAFFTYIAHGIWCGVPLVICGVMGVSLYSNPSRAMYNANIALSIITANFMILLVIFSSLSAVIDGHYSDVIIYHAINAVVGFSGLVVLIVHSAYSCAGVCCTGEYSVPVAFFPPEGTVPMQFINSDGAMMYPSYPHGVISVPLSQQMSVVPPHMAFPVGQVQ